MSKWSKLDVYPTVFRKNIVRSTQHILDSIKKSGPLLSPDERDQVLHTVDFALMLPETWDAVYTLFMVASPKMEESGYWIEWIPYLEKGVAQCQRIEDQRCEYDLALHLGLHYQQVGDFISAEKLFESAVEGFQQLGDRYKEGIALNYLASFHRRYGNYDRVEVLTKAASAIIAAKSPEQAQLYTTQATLLQEKREFEKALNYYTKAYDLFHSYNETKRASWAMQGIANSLSHLARYQESIDANKKAIQLQTEINSILSVAYTQMNLGTVYHMIDQFEKALSFYALAEPVLRRVRELYPLALLCHNQGRAYSELGHWKQSESAFLEGIAYWRHLNNPVYLANGLDDLGILYGKQGNHTKAFAILQEALEITKQIENLDVRNYRYKMVTEHLSETQPTDK